MFAFTGHCPSSHMTDGWNRQVAGTTTSESVISLWSPVVSQYHEREDVSSVKVGSVCLCKVSTWFMHKSAARWSQVVPWCTACGDLATGAVPLRWRTESVTAKQIWNRGTLCHKFLHSTQVAWMQGNLLTHLWAKKVRGPQGGKAGWEWGC